VLVGYSSRLRHHRYSYAGSCSYARSYSSRSRLLDEAQYPESRSAHDAYCGAVLRIIRNGFW
jgi:hypothetical protein